MWAFEMETGKGAMYLAQYRAQARAQSVSAQGTRSMLLDNKLAREHGVQGLEGLLSRTTVRRLQCGYS